MKIVTLVPWRPGDAERERLWGVVRPFLEDLGFPVYLGDSEGVWSRSAAVNRAARDAGAWDVAVVADADTIPTEEPIRRAVDLVLAKRGAIRPHDRLYVLNPGQTRIVVLRGFDALRLAPRQRTRPGGGLLVVERSAWETVGGYDERFVGWGHEDSALHTELLARTFWDRIPGEAFHLFHRFDRPRERFANRDRMEEIQAKYRREIDAASRSRGYDVGAIL